MPFSTSNRQGTFMGIGFIALIAVVASLISQIDAVQTLGISPLVVGIVIGIIFANTIHHTIPNSWESGITFSAKKILRFAIVFYGFRITFQQIAEVGLEGFLVSLTMLSTTFLLGTWLGTKIFKMDEDTSMLTASGASVCGAAAVLATEPVLKAEEHKAAIAVSMVVLFGTISMFLYPILYSSGILDMSAKEFGIYVGGTIHEVAQVVAVPASIPGLGEEAANSAVIVKMTRVIMIAPMLIILGIYLSFRARKEGGESTAVKLVIPWFAVYFIGVAGFNSLHLVPENIVNIINEVDTFLLTMAMSALGVGTRFAKFRGLGMAPLYTALGMFVWLVVGGYFVTLGVCGVF
ncbi:Putative membrane protein YeiH [hydrothermal vent metagenome]|uniref:Putative membrane protein YeiH n=1 Tax=hydrothermal vent metagenome TaxID=652676 RepID=A0A1W1BDY4_9ZZZZ